MLHLLKLLIFFKIALTLTKAEDSLYSVNSKKALHVVNDNFLSFSLDPAILLTRINLSDICLHMAKHLSPAYVRIAGPSLEYVTYVDSDAKFKDHNQDDGNIVVTPSVWFAINEWFNMANLTPVYGINDAETALGVWNPKSTLPLLELSDKFNLTCLWQLGYDCSSKTDVQYMEDLRTLRHILDAFPDKKGAWKIIGSNIRNCFNTRRPDILKKIFDELEGVADYIMWEPMSSNEILKNNDLPRLPFYYKKSYPKLWTIGSRNIKAVTFETALNWAKEVSDSARNGFDVILRQPRLHELFTDTPVFWFSVLHKNLAGNIVLDVVTANPDKNVDVSAYCARKQNSYIQRGAMTLVLVNKKQIEHNVQLRLNNLPKTMEVQSYILTSKSDLRSTYLNEKKLDVKILHQEKLKFSPKLRIAKPIRNLVITIPPKSIGFFVLPTARIPACIDENEEMTLLMEELKKDQELPLSKEIAIDLEPRILNKGTKTLKDIQEKMEHEFEADSEFYHIKNGKTNQRLEEALYSMEDKLLNDNFNLKHRINNQTKQLILEKVRGTKLKKELIPDKIKTNETKNKFTENMISRFGTDKNVKTNSDNENNSPEVELELSSAEIKNILKERVKSRAAQKNIVFTDNELNQLVKKATIQLKKDKILVDKYRSRRFASEEDNFGQFKNSELNFKNTFIRTKRDINKSLLNEAVKHIQLKKLAGRLDEFSGENSSDFIEKSTKSPINNSKLIVNPFYKPKIDKKVNDKNIKSKFLEDDEDFDSYIDEDSKALGDILHEYSWISNKNDGNKLSSDILELEEKSKVDLGLRSRNSFNMKDKTPIGMDEKYLRLSEYFKNSKKAQSRFDGIEMSLEDDYGDFDELRRRKREQNFLSKDSHYIYNNNEVKHVQVRSKRKVDIIDWNNDLIPNGIEKESAANNPKNDDENNDYKYVMPTKAFKKSNADDNTENSISIENNEIDNFESSLGIKKSDPLEINLFKNKYFKHFYQNKQNDVKPKYPTGEIVISNKIEKEIPTTTFKIDAKTNIDDQIHLFSNKLNLTDQKSAEFEISATETLLDEISSTTETEEHTRTEEDYVNFKIISRDHNDNIEYKMEDPISNQGSWWQNVLTTVKNWAYDFGKKVSNYLGLHKISFFS